ncbi:MAG: sulfite exporter TauE/SafE family protein [Bacteroidales bacterium]|nr:sulfite exporter TauE/SafE family protein [Bacteroidales bacterium]
MDWFDVSVLILVGLVAGFINTLAGSGSLITLPILMFLGLPPTVANGTNRIAVLLQSLVGVAKFKQKKVFEWKEGTGVLIPAILGSLLGAFIAVDIDKEVMRKVIGFLLIFMFLMLLTNSDKWIKGQEKKVTGTKKILQYVIFFLIGIYGGFIQAGVGFFLLAGLVLGSGFDLLKSNAVKLLVVAVFTPFALAVFIWNDQVDYLYGFVLAIGNVAGALVATRVAMKYGTGFIRYFLMAILFFAGLQLFGIFEWLFQLMK